MPGMLQSMESQRVRHDWVTELKAMTIYLESVSVINPIHVHICGLHGLGDNTPNQYALLYVAVHVFHSSGFYLLHFLPGVFFFVVAQTYWQARWVRKLISLRISSFFFFFNIYLFIFGHAESLLLCGFFSPRTQWHPTPVRLPGKSHGRRSLVGCSPWDRWGLDMTEQLHFHFSLSCIGEGKGSPLQCSCLENPRDSRAWWAAVYGVTQSRTWLKRLSSSSSQIN